MIQLVEMTLMRSLTKESSKTRAKKSRATNPSTVDLIVRATLKRIRESGFAGVSMRLIASDLGLTAMALYRHFHDKDALLERVAEHIYASIPMPPADLHWSERLRIWFLTHDRVQLKHPGLAGFVVKHRLESIAAMQWMDCVLGILRAGGLHEEDVLHGFNQLSFLMNPMVFLDAAPRSLTERMFSHAHARQVLASRSQQFPQIAEMLDRIPMQPYEAHFAMAIDGVIEGLSLRVERRERQRDAKTSKIRSRARRKAAT